MHIKRQRAPNKWPTHRKGTKFIVKPNSDFKTGIPILVVLRDLLKFAQNRKEVKKAIHLGNILVNQRKIKDNRHGLSLFDKITIVPTKTHYILSLSEKGKFALEEVKDSSFKIAKVKDKKTLKGKKTQLNLSDGRNFISDMACKVNDSVKIDFEAKKITECLPLKVQANVIIFAGKHSGKKGQIEKIDLKNKMAEISIGEGKINVLIKQLMVIQ